MLFDNTVRTYTEKRTVFEISGAGEVKTLTCRRIKLNILHLTTYKIKLNQNE